MLLWDAACIVHEEFKARGLADMRKLYPDAAILAHPESPSAVLEVADVIGSTTQIINAAKQSTKKEIIVAHRPGHLSQITAGGARQNIYHRPYCWQRRNL